MNLKHSTGQTGSSATPSASKYVPEMVPIPTPETQPHRHIEFLTALFTFWLRPKQLGPHLSADPFRRALAAYVISVIAVLCIIPISLAWDRHINFIPMHDQAIQVRIAHCILGLATDSTEALHNLKTSNWNWTTDWVMRLLVAFGVSMLLVPLGTLLMPLAAAGDQPWSVWKRSVKNVYWCTTLAVPITLAWAMMYNAANWHFYQPQMYYIPCDPYAGFGIPLLIGGAVLMLACLAMLARALHIATHCCVGQTVQPLTHQRPAQCDECGYLLRGLAMDTKCPECGLPVRESLLGGRRRLSAWQSEGLKRMSWSEMIRMQWSAINGKAMLRDVPVYRGVAAARSFWWLTWFLMAVLLIVTTQAITFFSPLHSELRINNHLLSLATASLPLVLLPFMMFLACQWGHRRYGIRDYRVSAIVCYHTSPAMWPSLMIVLVMVILTQEPFLQSVQANMRNIQYAGGLLAFACIGLWLHRVFQAMKHVQYACE